MSKHIADEIRRLPDCDFHRGVTSLARALGACLSPGAFFDTRVCFHSGDQQATLTCHIVALCFGCFETMVIQVDYGSPVVRGAMTV